MLTDASRNFGNALVGAAGQIRQRRDQSQDRNALTNYLQNPDDPQAFIGAAERNPAQAFQLQEHHMERIRGLRQDQREQLRLAGRLLRDQNGQPIRDDAGYQRARSAAQRLGLDIAGIPETYDPNWVEQTLVAADAAEAPQRQEDYTLGRGDIRYRGGREIARGAAPPDQVIAVVPGGRAEVVSPQWPPQGAVPQPQQPQTQPQQQALPQVNTQEEAMRLPPGSQFIGPDGLVHIVPGGPTQPGSGGF